ncbi:hypothetical protein MNBD_GAMMA12-3238 [hydrothermal vent metagenome]|uniref:DUF3179 domain-containing protein n=1 Tax=hydrothermal vent metagenome TaxID=652676 RepID=A0A3B0ZE08_9ZZZZ
MNLLPTISLLSFIPPKISRAVILSTLVIVTFNFNAQAQSKNGFDLSNTSIKKSEIISGGPRRDGIPSINHPKFIDAKKVNFLKDSDIVIGLTRGNITRAYPTRILVWHEIVNDIINNDPVVITYCPLCGTGMIFKRQIKGKLVSFGVSGLLYRSDVLMYDRKTNSLWSQLLMKAVSGTEIGTQLEWLPSEYSTWKAWKQKYPNGKVLSLDTGYTRDYRSESAYAEYRSSNNIMFPVPQTRRELPNKELVIGVILHGKAKAYPIKFFSKKSVVKDTLANSSLLIRYNKTKKSHEIVDSKGKQIPSVLVYWFAWQAFYPQTELWTK